MCDAGELFAMTIDTLIEYLEDAREQIGGQAEVLFGKNGYDIKEVDIQYDDPHYVIIR